MKWLFRIVELSKSEQRVVLIVMSVLITVVFVGYERRVHQRLVQPISAIEAKPSASPVQIKHER
jgi:hypothetical protein